MFRRRLLGYCNPCDCCLKVITSMDNSLTNKLEISRCCCKLHPLLAKHTRGQKQPVRGTADTEEGQLSNSKLKTREGIKRTRTLRSGLDMARLDVLETFHGISFPGHLHTQESLQSALKFPFQESDILITSYPKSGKERAEPRQVFSNSKPSHSRLGTFIIRSF